MNGSNPLGRLELYISNLMVFGIIARDESLFTSCHCYTINGEGLNLLMERVISYLP